MLFAQRATEMSATTMAKKLEQIWLCYLQTEKSANDGDEAFALAAFTMFVRMAQPGGYNGHGRMAAALLSDNIYDENTIAKGVIGSIGDTLKSDLACMVEEFYVKHYGEDKSALSDFFE